MKARQFWGCLILSVALSACATIPDRERVALSDVNRDLARRFQADHELNGLHPAHTGTVQGDRIVWTDFCQGKECDEPQMTYTRFSREVAITAATVSQFAFVAQKIEQGKLSAEEAEPFLEFGWFELPALDERIAHQWRQLVQLNPDRDFKNQILRQHGWDTIAVAADQLERAEEQLDGLGQRVATLYRNVNPAFACEEEPEPEGTIVVIPPERESEIAEVSDFLVESGELEQPVPEQALRVIVQRGLRSIYREQRAAARSERVSVTRLRIDGPLEKAATHDWIEGRADALADCLPPEQRQSVAVEVMGLYSTEAVISDVRLAHTGLSIPVVTCLRNALEDTAVAGDIPREAGGIRLTLTLHPTGGDLSAPPPGPAEEEQASPEEDRTRDAEITPVVR